MISLPIRLSINYQVKQVNTEIGKKHRSKNTYNNPNVHIKTIVPCIYIIKHLFQQFINGFLGIALFSKEFNHAMNSVTNREPKVLVDCFQMLVILGRGVE